MGNVDAADHCSLFVSLLTYFVPVVMLTPLRCAFRWLVIRYAVRTLAVVVMTTWMSPFRFTMSREKHGLVCMSGGVWNVALTTFAASAGGGVRPAVHATAAPATPVSSVRLTNVV